MAGVKIHRVANRRGLKAFIDLPWQIYESASPWTPPVKKDLKNLLDAGRHPFWRFSERELFIAYRGEKPVGRIAAIVDNNSNRCHGEKAGVWGFFECENDPEAATNLFIAAENWQRNKGMAFIRGPLNPSLNYEAGLLIEGFETSPALMLPYNPPFYSYLVESCGYRKEKDLFSFRVTKEYQPPEWAFEISRRIVERNEIRVEPPDLKNMPDELFYLNDLYAKCWSSNWGFVPMTREEIKTSARGLMQLLDRDFAFYLCHGDQKIGAFLALPDANPFLHRLNGHLGPSALVKKILYWSEIRGLRVLLFGVLEKYKNMGVPMVAFHHIMDKLRNGTKYDYIEAGWTLEDNHEINQIFTEGGIHPSRRYRIYRKDI